MKKYRVVIVNNEDASADALSSSLRYGWKIETSYRLEDGGVAFILYKVDEETDVDEQLLGALEHIERRFEELEKLIEGGTYIA